jgi:hypothetical protein
VIALSYLPGVNSEIFSAKVDVRSLVTCLSVSTGILDFNQMVEITSTRSPYTINGIVYNTSTYYDPQFPGMTPLACIQTDSGTQQQCILQINGMYALPFFHHKGNNTNLPQKCICQYISDEDKLNSFAPCNRFDFLVGFLFFPNASNIPDALYDLVAKYDFNYTIINKLSFEASFIAGYWGQQSPYYASYLNAPLTRAKYYSFCDIDTGTHTEKCSLLTFSTFDTTRHDWSISKYYYQLMWGACRDCVSTSWTYWYSKYNTLTANILNNSC